MPAEENDNDYDVILEEILQDKIEFEDEDEDEEE